MHRAFLLAAALFLIGGCGVPQELPKRWAVLETNGQISFIPKTSS